MTKDLRGIASWLSVNKLTLNVLKTDFMVIGSRQKVASLEGEINLSLFYIELERVNAIFKMPSIRQKVTRNLNILKKVRPVLKVENLIDIYRSIIEPYTSHIVVLFGTL